MRSSREETRKGRKEQREQVEERRKEKGAGA